MKKQKSILYINKYGLLCCSNKECDNPIIGVGTFQDQDVFLIFKYG